MGYSVPTEGTATCLACGEIFRSWRRDPMNPCQRCGSYAVVWSPELIRDLPDQAQMAREWMADQRSQQARDDETRKAVVEEWE